MRYEILVTGPFERKFKRLSKKYRSLKSDLALILDQLSSNPSLGMSLGKNCYKIRLAISAKGTGKSGGARVITYVRFSKETIYLLDIYDKSEQDSISDKELIQLIEMLIDG